VPIAVVGLFEDEEPARRHQRAAAKFPVMPTGSPRPAEAEEEVRGSICKSGGCGGLDEAGRFSTLFPLYEQKGSRKGGGGP